MSDNKMDTHSVMTPEEYEEAKRDSEPTEYEYIQTVAVIDGYPVQFSIACPTHMHDRGVRWCTRQRQLNHGSELKIGTYKCRASTWKEDDDDADKE